MFFNPDEITPKKIQVTPRVCHGGELLAIWIDAYGKASATHIWDIGVARAFCNRDEIEAAIAAEMNRTGLDRITAAKSIILRSGVYELKSKDTENKSIELTPEIASALKSAADMRGLTIEQYIQQQILG